MQVIVENSWNVSWSYLVEGLRLNREFALRMRCHLHGADEILVVPRLLRPIVLDVFCTTGSRAYS